MNAPRALAVTLAVAAASSAALLAGCGGGGTTLNLTVENGARTVVDLTGTGPGQGDLLAVEGALVDPAGARIGDFHLYAAVTRTDATSEVRSTNAYISWNDSADSLMFMGAPRYPAGGGLPTEPVRFAVVGGTGQYAGAGGQATVTFTKPSTFDWQVELD